MRGSIQSTIAALLLIAMTVGALYGTARAYPPRGDMVAGGKIESTLEYLLAIRDERLGDGTPPRAITVTDRAAALIALEERFAGSLRFSRTPVTEDFDMLRDLGVSFYDHGGGISGSRTVFPALIPFASLSALRSLDLVVRVECAWRPHMNEPPLARSRPQIETPQAWEVSSPLGGSLSGEGVLICDIDTGISYLHTSFFRKSGERFDWIDVDASGDLSSGDAVDLNGNGSADGDEDLVYIEVQGTEQYGNNLTEFNLEFDVLYNDASGNGSRGCGPPEFNESDPTYGERLFVVDDVSGNLILDTDEQLIGLGESMIRAIYNKNGTVYRRGVDLVESEGDGWGHGTQVGGIFGGEHKGRAMAGIAPGVESINVNYDFTGEPPFLLPVEAGLAWAIEEGADIVLFEDGEWVWEYLDGSSNLEIMINEYAADDNVIFIIPAGNLATGNMHTVAGSADTMVLTNNSGQIAWPSFLWTEPVNLTVHITPPGGTAIELPGDATTVTAQGYRIYSNFTISDRGTRRVDVRLATNPEGGNIDGDWLFTFSGDAVSEIHGYFCDNVSSWTSSSNWQRVVPTHTVTWPATADSAISIAAYNPMDDGDINSYSGWGPRIDGRRAVDIAAPGGSVVSASPWNNYQFTTFGGTSSAGPHVAGAAALLRELLPSLDNGLCRNALHLGAALDEWTGDVNRWGAGKLRIRAAITSLLMEIINQTPDPEMAVSSWPNPFNPYTNIRFNAPSAGVYRVRVFSADGREIWTSEVSLPTPGLRDITWRGQDNDGREMPSGIYFAHVSNGREVAAIKMTLLK
ncbi:MAG: S8 family serine peptidase [bacterium]|nr:S8 family serine peptidase [bacterium]